MESHLDKMESETGLFICKLDPHLIYYIDEHHSVHFLGKWIEITAQLSASDTVSTQ